MSEHLLQVLIDQGKEQTRVNQNLADNIGHLETKIELFSEKHNATDEKISDLEDFRERAEPIIQKSKERHEFSAGLWQKIVYTVVAGAIFAVCSYAGVLVYDNAGKARQSQAPSK